MRDVEAGRESALMIGRGCELSGDGRGGRCADDLAVPGTERTCKLTFHERLFSLVASIIIYRKRQPHACLIRCAFHI